MSPAAFPENIASITSEKKRTDLDVAAVDLGSNSFHMIIARFQGEDLTILDRLREPVRLADGLDAEHRLSPEAQERDAQRVAELGLFGAQIHRALELHQRLGARLGLGQGHFSLLE